MSVPSSLTTENLKDSVNGLRSVVGFQAQNVKALADEIKGLSLTVSPTTTPTPDRGEMIANAMLAYRHLEDARMRLGKVIQAFEGGVSCYEGQ